LIEFKINNQKYLELESKIHSIIEMGNRNLLNPALQTIHSYSEKYPKVCTFPKVQLLTGELYFSFWKLSNEELKRLADKMIGIKENSSEYTFIVEKIEKEGEVNKRMIDLAKNAFKASHEARPTYWKANEALYKLHVEMDELNDAKHYLGYLISSFPAEATYSLKMGRLNEISNRFTNSVNFFLESAEKALHAGVSNLKKEDLLEIIDASLRTGKKLMKQMNISELSAKAENALETRTMLKNMRKNNAQLRVTLEKMSRQFPNDPEYLNKIAITYRRTGEYHIAEEYYKKAIQADKNDAVIRINYAMCLACSNIFDKATEMIESAAKLEMNDEEKETYEKSRELINKKDIVRIKKVMI
ncbi:MAG: tetratricopeptide repeat protein, partial [Nitrospinae bacterium]|nr:tetratricopeptide repeat protein [Nitrospinota bacterium]